MPKKPANSSQPKYTIYKYTVIRFDDENSSEKLFECIPDRWFLDEFKSQCYWPPNTGAAFSLRAIRCEKPDESTWNVYDVEVISEGHLTYNSGFKIVVEKCKQKYNTSSADERIDAEIYRRKHPVLAMQNNDGDLENIFANSKKKHSGKSVETGGSSVPKTKSGACQTSSSSRKANVNSSMAVEENEGDKNENNLSLDSTNENSCAIDGQNVREDTPKVTSLVNTSLNKTIDSPRANSPKQSQTSHSKLKGSRSRSNVSDSSGSRSHYSGSHCPDRPSMRQKQRRSRSSNSIRSGSRSSVSDNRRAEMQKTTHRQPIFDSISIRSGSSSSVSDNRRAEIQKTTHRQPNFDSKKNSSTNKNFLTQSNGNVKKSERKKQSEAEHFSSRQSMRTRSVESISCRSKGSKSSHSSSRSKSRSPHSFLRNGYRPKTGRNLTSGCKNSSTMNNNGSLNENSITSNEKRKNLEAEQSSSRDSRDISRTEHFNLKTGNRHVSDGNSTKKSNIRSNVNANTANRKRKNSKEERTSRLTRSCSTESISSRLSGPTSRCTSNRKKSKLKRNTNNRSVGKRGKPLERNGTENFKSNSKRRRMSTHRSRSSLQRSGSEYTSSYSRHSSDKQSNNPGSSRAITSESSADLVRMVKNLSETVNRRLRENERRMCRMEVTVNKIFVLVGDLSGHTGPLHDELANDKGFEIPELPIERTKELAALERKLKDKEFRYFLVQHEKEFCCPTNSSTDTVTISKYLARFISLRMRTKLTLKESGEDGITLFKDYHNVYQFLIDVMKAGYHTCRKNITNDGAHSALRIVWGRSKQYFRDQQERNQQRKRR